MSTPLIVEFQVQGVSRIKEAFSSVVSAQQKMENQIATSVGREGRARETIAAKMRAMREREYADLFKQIEKKEKAEERSAASAIKADEKRFNAIIKRLDQEVKDVEKAEQAKLHARDVAAKRALDIQLNSSKMTGKLIADQVREEANARKRITGSIASTVSGSAGRAVGTVAKVAGSILALGGGFSVADGIHQSVRNSGKAADLANQAGGAISKEQILKKSADIGSQMGVSTESVIGGLDEFVAKSGDVKAGFAGIQKLVELAAATGADLGELSRTAGIIHMGTGDIGKTMDQMRTLAGAGRAGSVDMRELSQYAGRISSGANEFGDKGKAFNQLSTIVQQAAATGGATAAPEATEAVTRLSSDIYEHEGVFKSKGIKTRDKSGKFLRDPMDIIKESISKTGGDSSQLLGMFGKMSIRAVNGYKDVYNRASEGVKGAGGSQKEADAAGLAAIDAAFKKIADAALTDAQVKADSDKRVSEADRQLEMVMNRLREAVGNELVPELIKLIPEIKSLIPAFVDLLKHVVAFGEWFSKNPLSGLGALVLANVTKDLGAAGIGAAVKAELGSILAGAMAGGAGGTGVVGTTVGAVKGGLAGATAAGPLAAAGVAAAVTMNEQREAILGGQTSGQRRVGELLADAQDPKNAPAVRAALDRAVDGSGIGGATRAYFGMGAAGAGAAVSYVTGKPNAPAKDVADFVTNREIAANAERIAKALEKAAKGAEGLGNQKNDPRNDPSRQTSGVHPTAK